MPIKLNIKQGDQDNVKQLGGRLLPDGNTWIIPDEILDINPFMTWLPSREGHIVQKPYFSLRAKCLCWKCKCETPVVALGAKSHQALVYETADNPIWQKVEDDRLIFAETDYLDKGISRVMQANYPFFQQRYLPSIRHRIWGNCCIHCQALQEEDLEYTCGFASPFTPNNPAEKPASHVSPLSPAISSSYQGSMAEAEQNRQTPPASLSPQRKSPTPPAPPRTINAQSPASYS